MYLGRGRFTTDNLAAQYQTLKETFETRQAAVLEMMETASLGEDLLDGLEELKKARVDVDKMNLKAARTRK